MEEKAGNSAIICARDFLCKATRRLFGGYLQQPEGAATTVGLFCFGTDEEIFWRREM